MLEKIVATALMRLFSSILAVGGFEVLEGMQRWRSYWYLQYREWLQQPYSGRETGNIKTARAPGNRKLRKQKLIENKMK